MKAKPNTVVGDLAICSNCNGTLSWHKQFQFWYHIPCGNQHCGSEDKTL